MTIDFTSSPVPNSASNSLQATLTEQHFTLDGVRGILWRPAGTKVPTPLILLGLLAGWTECSLAFALGLRRRQPSDSRPPRSNCRERAVGSHLRTSIVLALNFAPPCEKKRRYLQTSSTD